MAAAKLINTTHVNVGINDDEIIIIAPGDRYTVSRRRDGTARIGGAGLVRQLIERGAIPGSNYKLHRKDEYWEAYPMEAEGPELPQDLRPKRGRRKGTQ